MKPDKYSRPVAFFLGAVLVTLIIYGKMHQTKERVIPAEMVQEMHR